MESAFESIRNFSGPHRWSEIIIHHSATPDGKVNDWEPIHRWHMGKIGSPDKRSEDYNPYIAKPDRDIGYHFGIDYVVDRYVYQIGRALTWDGAHCINHNMTGIGICVIGNYDLKPPNDTQYFLTASLCRALMDKFGIGTEGIRGHREFANKTCPGKLFSLETLKGYIAGTHV